MITPGEGAQPETLQETCKQNLFPASPTEESQRVIWARHPRARGTSTKGLTTGTAANANGPRNPAVAPTGLLSEQQQQAKPTEKTSRNMSRICLCSPPAGQDTCPACRRRPAVAAARAPGSPPRKGELSCHVHDTRTLQREGEKVVTGGTSSSHHQYSAL